MSSSCSPDTVLCAANSNRKPHAWELPNEFVLGDQRDIPAVLASLDISVLPSESESLSNAILESMAAGVPVVASRVGGNPELVNEERGILFAPNSEENLAAAIRRLLLDEGRRSALGRNARAFAQAGFTAEQMEDITKSSTLNCWRGKTGSRIYVASSPRER